MNPFTAFAKNIITKLQRKHIYQPPSEPIKLNELKSIIPDIKYVSFKDEKGKEHRFLYKEPLKGENKTNFFLGGTELNLNNSSYQNFVKNLCDQNKENGLIIPLYPGYHQKKDAPSEKKLKDSCEKIYQALTNQKTNFTIENNKDQQIPHLPENSLNIIGYSLGGTLAAHLAFKANHINKLVLIATPASIRDFSVESAKENGGLQAFIAKFPKLFGEKYDTIESIKGINPKTQIDLISTINDSFSEGKNSHFNRLANSLKERKNGTYNISLLPLKIGHEEILHSKQIVSTIAKANNNKLSLNKDAISPNSSKLFKDRIRSNQITTGQVR